MKRSSNGDSFEELLSNPAYVAMGGVVSLLVVVLFCFIVWNVSHQSDNNLVVNNQSSNTVEIPSMDESSDEIVAATPIPVQEVDEEQEELDKLVREESNDQGLVFEEMNDWVTAVEVTNLRSEPSTSQGINTVVVKLENGVAVRRVGINLEVGWSKLIYDDKVVYASTAYLVDIDVPVSE